MSAIHYANTNWGFCWGAAKIERCCFDLKKGWVTLTIQTPKHQMGKNEIQIYVTKSGKVRISDRTGEWKKPKEAKP